MSNDQFTYATIAMLACPFVVYMLGCRRSVAVDETIDRAGDLVYEWWGEPFATIWPIVMLLVAEFAESYTVTSTAWFVIPTTVIGLGALASCV